MILRHIGKIEKKVYGKRQYLKDMKKDEQPIPCLYYGSSQHKNILYRFHGFLRGAVVKNQNKTKFKINEKLVVYITQIPHKLKW